MEVKLLFSRIWSEENSIFKTEEIEIIKSWDGIVEFSDFDQMNLTDKDGLLTKNA